MPGADRDPIADALARLLADPALRERFGQAGIETAKDLRVGAADRRPGGVRYRPAEST
jgi:hypothetical protein